VRIELSTGTPAELALPEDGTARGVVLVPDIMGLRPLFDELCVRLAGYGWAVCAVEPWPGREGLTLEQRFAAAAELDDDDKLADFDAARDVLAEQGSGRVGVLGFCMGGMYTLKAAASGHFDRAVAFYGMIRVPADWRGPHQIDPIELLKGPDTCPTLAIIGGRDPYTPPEDVAALRQLRPVIVAFYPEAEHGFVHDPARPAHRPDDASDAWRRAADFLS
jgi:carboxymethylenebutenolidase